MLSGRLGAGSTSIRVVGDQTCTPTFTQDLARQLAALLETGVFGLYHITSDGETTWHDFAAEIFRIARLKPDLQPTTSVEFNAPAIRPPYSVLENRALKSLSIDCMRPWREALADYLEQKLG